MQCVYGALLFRDKNAHQHLSMLPVLEFADETVDISTPVLFKKKHSSVQCVLIAQILAGS